MLSAPLGRLLALQPFIWRGLTTSAHPAVQALGGCQVQLAAKVPHDGIHGQEKGGHYPWFCASSRRPWAARGHARGPGAAGLRLGGRSPRGACVSLSTIFFWYSSKIFFSYSSLEPPYSKNILWNMLASNLPLTRGGAKNERFKVKNVQFRAIFSQKTC